jgi:hypothetical protein
MGGASGAGGGSADNAGAPGEGGTTTDDLVPRWSDRCGSAPRIALGQLPSCNLGDETILDDLALTRNAIALDAERVYYVGNPPPGISCPDSNEDCSAVLSVSKEGGSVRVHGAAEFTQQIAVDDDYVYWDDIELEYATKAGVGGYRTYLNAAGVIATGNAVYTVIASPWAFVRLTTPLTRPPQGEVLAELPDLFVGPRTLVTDFMTEETSRSVLRLDLSNGSITPLCIDTYPTALAADESHIYLNAEWLDAASKYYGKLVRVALDGSDACIVASDLEYLSAPIVDDEHVYWVAQRQLHKLPK